MPNRKSFSPETRSDLPKSRMDIRQNTVKSATGLADKRVAVIDIEGPIGWDIDKWWNGEEQDTTSKAFRDKIAEVEALDVAEIKVNIIESPGGSVEDGIGMYEALVKSRAVVTTEVVGYAASIATVIMMAGGTRKISANAMTLSHEVMTPIFGYANKTELAEHLDYVTLVNERCANILKKHGVNMEGLQEYIDANNGNGKWMTAEKAVELNLATEVFEPYSEETISRMPMEGFRAVAHAYNLPEMVKEPINTAPGSRGEPTKTKQEADMPLTPEETQQIVDKTASAVIVALEASALEKKEAGDKANADLAIKNAVVVTFEGDPESQEDLSAHSDKLERAQLLNACDFNDVASVQIYQKALKALNSDETDATTRSNVDVAGTSVKYTPDGNSKDLADTASAMKAINERDKERR